jgi:hypothetical protein
VIALCSESDQSVALAFGAQWILVHHARSFGLEFATGHAFGAVLAWALVELGAGMIRTATAAVEG